MLFSLAKIYYFFEPSKSFCKRMRKIAHYYFIMNTNHRYIVVVLSFSIPSIESKTALQAVVFRVSWFFATILSKTFLCFSSKKLF